MDDTLQKLRDQLILYAPRLATALALLVAFAIAARSAAVSGLKGMVAHIGLRYTTLALDDERRALVPNSAMFSNPITVASRSAAEAGATARPALAFSSAMR